MDDLLQELRAEIERVDPEAAARLRPGLSAAAAKLRVKLFFPHRVTDDASALYRWADGAEGRVELLPGAYFVPSTYVIQQGWLIKLISPGVQRVAPDPYRKAVRFLTDWSDGGYALGAVDSPSAGAIVSMSIHAPWKIAFRSLSDLLRTSVECYRRGIIQADDATSDFSGFARLAAELNPASEAWRRGSN